MAVDEGRPCRDTAEAVKARKDRYVNARRVPIAMLPGAPMAEIYARSGRRVGGKLQ
jgi:hypothetical protein